MSDSMIKSSIAIAAVYSLATMGVQVKRAEEKKNWRETKIKTKIQFLEFWGKIQVKIQDFAKKIFLEFLIQFNWIYLIQFLLFGAITFHNLKYPDKPVKCLKMRANQRSVRKIN